MFIRKPTGEERIKAGPWVATGYLSNYVIDVVQFGDTHFALALSTSRNPEFLYNELKSTFITQNKEEYMRIPGWSSIRIIEYVTLPQLIKALQHITIELCAL